MDVMRREDIHHLFQDILKEIVGSDVARTEISLLVRLMGTG